MKDSHSEQLNVKKAMKLNEILSSDKSDFELCKNDLMKKVALDSKSAKVVAESIRDMFLPKLLEEEGIELDELPDSFIGKMADYDDHFATENPEDMHDDTDEEGDHEDDEFDADGEVDGDEIATIHISVPADKIREVEKALESVLGETDADSKDQAHVHKDGKNTGDKDMDKKQLEARKALRKTILAAMQDDEHESVSRKNEFDYASSEQYREEDHYDTKKGDFSDPEFDTLNYADQKIPNFTDLIDHIGTDLGLNQSLKPISIDGVPTDADDFVLEFNAFEIPSQGADDEFHEATIMSEGKLPRKRTINSSVLGEFDADEAEEALAYALRSAGVDENDLGKITYAEGLELFKAIRTANEERTHYSKDGKMPNEKMDYNDPHKGDPDKKKAVTEDDLMSNNKGDKESKPRKESYSSADKKDHDEYASMLKKIMRGDKDHKMAEDDEDGNEKEAEDKITLSPDMVEVGGSKNKDLKQAELYKARLKTAYACSSKLALAGILPGEEVDAYAEGMLTDGLTVGSMIKQTKLMLANAAAHAEKLAASNGKATKVASTGITFNPTVRTANSDLSGAMDIQNALRNIGWTTAKVETGMEE